MTRPWWNIAAALALGWILWQCAAFIAGEQYMVLALLVAGLLCVVLIFTKPWAVFLLLIMALPFTGKPDIPLKLPLILGALALVSLLLRVVLTKSLPVPRTPLTIPLMAFTAVLAVSILQSRYIDHAVYVFGATIFNEPYNKSVYQFAIILVNLALFYLTLYWVKDEARLRTVIMVWIWTAIAVSCIGLYGFYGAPRGLPAADLFAAGWDGPIGTTMARVQSVGEEPVFFGTYLLTIVPVLFVALWKRPRMLPLPLGLGACALFVVTIYLTFSRATFLGLAAGLLVAAWCYRRLLMSRWYLVASIVAVAILGIVWLNFTLQAGTFLSNQASGLAAGEDFSALVRLDGYLAAWNMFLAYPVLGVGIGNFHFHFSQYAPPFHEALFSWVPGTPIFAGVNNVFLTVMAEEGILGLAALVWVIGAFLWWQAKAMRAAGDGPWRPWLVGCLAAFIAVMVNLQFVSLLYYPSLWVFLGVIASVQHLALQESRSGPPRTEIRPHP